MKNQFLILALFVFKISFANGEIFENKIFKDNIKTVQLEIANWEVSYPILDLNSNQQLQLSFDDFLNETQDYSYKIIHCEADWTISDLSENEYIDGFSENQIPAPRSSFNTLTHYFHYKLRFPNEDLQLKLSGNYIIKVYNNYDENDLVLIRRFSISEAIVPISGSVTRANLSKYYRTHQKVDFHVFLNKIQVNDPFSDVKVIVAPNNIAQLSKTDLKPQFINNNELIYEYDDENCYPAFNEFRSFDIKTLKFNMDHVARIFSEDKQYLVRLYDDESRRFKVYISDADINGSYIIRCNEYNDYEIDADYAWIYFYLRMPEPVTDGDLYVFGALSNWTTSKTNKMVYNYERKAYQLKLLLKQGYYNFEYVFANPEKQIFNPSRIEGSHYETENDYLIYVYAKGFGDNYDRLVGFNILNYPKNNRTLFK